MKTPAWIDWHGSICPVHLATKVLVRFDNGVQRTLIAGNLDWSPKPKDGATITAYKVAKAV